jgi:hypothetical protein
MKGEITETASFSKSDDLQRTDFIVNNIKMPEKAERPGN